MGLSGLFHKKKRSTSTASSDPADLATRQHPPSASSPATGFSPATEQAIATGNPTSPRPGEASVHGTDGVDHPSDHPSALPVAVPGHSTVTTATTAGTADDVCNPPPASSPLISPRRRRKSSSTSASSPRSSRVVPTATAWVVPGSGADSTTPSSPQTNEATSTGPDAADRRSTMLSGGPPSPESPKLAGLNTAYRFSPHTTAADHGVSNSNRSNGIQKGAGAGGAGIGALDDGDDGVMDLAAKLAGASLAGGAQDGKGGDSGRVGVGIETRSAGVGAGPGAGLGRGGNNDSVIEHQPAPKTLAPPPTSIFSSEKLASLKTGVPTAAAPSTSPTTAKATNSFSSVSASQPSPAFLSTTESIFDDPQPEGTTAESLHLARHAMLLPSANGPRTHLKPSAVPHEQQKLELLECIQRNHHSADQVAAGVLDDRGLDVFRLAGMEVKDPEGKGVIESWEEHWTEPVVQEHVTPVEHRTYETIIDREVHKYHIQ